MTVPDGDVEAVKGLVSTPVWAMIQLQKLTGMRPGEVCILRSCDLNMTRDVWEYRPSSHKTEHHGRRRTVFIGLQGQAILKPFLVADPLRFVFSPADGREEYNLAKRVNRKSPMTPSQAARQRKNDPKRAAGECYTVRTYGRAIRRACQTAEIAVWAPNRLPHNAATELRKQFDIETVRTILGHASGFTTEVYAELDHEKARSVMGRVG